MQLFITSNVEGSRAVTLVERSVLRVGRAEECEVRLVDPSVSRVQFELRVDLDRVWMKDAGSRFGTFVNGVKTSECELRAGDVIRAGETTLRIQGDSAELRSTVAPSADRGGEFFESPSRAPTVEFPTLNRHAAVPTPSINPRQLPGRRFGRFDVTALAAETSRGMLLRAFDDHLRVDVALQVFYPETMRDAAAVARFRRAAQTMLPLTHEHLVELFDVGEDEGLCWAASEWVDGENARQMIRRIGIAGMLDWRQSLKVAMHVAKALDFAAQHQIVHRNLAPQRILVRKTDGVVKLGGLGLAKSLDDDESAKVTRAGEIVGDVAYCSPEQVGGKRLDARSDLYNLGTTVYALLTGRPPCEGRSFHETLDKIQSQRPEPPTKFHLAVPPMFEGIVMRLLEKRPEDRFASAALLLTDLKRAAKYLGETSLVDE